MDYQKLIIEVPPLSDEAAASLQRFLYDLMYAIDEHYYPQIQRYYMRLPPQENTKDHRADGIHEDPPF
jgi:hypothetical protein